MANRYVNVAITRQTQAVSKQGFGTPLILAPEKDFALKEYTDLPTVGVDYTTGSDTYKVAQALFNQDPKPAKVLIVGVLFTEGTTATTALTNKLDATRLINDDWYYLVSPAHADATITALSTWAEATNKLYFTSTANKVLAATLSSKTRTVVMVHPLPNTFPGEAWVGLGAPKDIGSFTWTFKTLNGIDPSGYVATDINTIEGNKASTYIKEGGVNITSKGVTTSGEYIDIIQSQDFISARMAEAVFNLMVNTDKIPYTINGIAMVVSALESVLKDAHDQGIIAEGINNKPLFTVTVPSLTAITSTDKANRLLPDVKWTATIAGAVENVDINGVLTL